MAKNASTHSFQDRIHQIIAAATVQIAAAARAEITAELKRVSAAVVRPAAKPAKAAKGKRKAGRPAAAPTAAPAGKPGRRGRKKRGGGGDASGQILAAIKANPGKRAEQIQQLVGLGSVDVKAALAKLREAGSVKTAGQARGTSYTAA